MLRSPVARRVVAVGHVKRRRERPLALPVHQEGDVLDVIVLVTRDHVERHAPELLFHRRHRQIELSHHQQCLLAGVSPGVVEIEMGQGT